MLSKKYFYRALALGLALALITCEQPDTETGGPEVIKTLPTSWTKVAGVPGQMPGEIQTVCYGVVNGKGRFVAGSRENDGRIAWSDDGITWTGLGPEKTTFGDNFTHVRFLNGEFWAVGGQAHMARSTDGEFWTAVSVPADVTQHNIVDIAYGNGVFVIGGDAANMAYSTDGGKNWIKNWQEEYFGAANFKAMEFHEGKFLAVGQLCRAIYSDNGINWTDISKKTAEVITGDPAAEPPHSGSGWYGMSVATYGDGLYIVASQGVLGLSGDLETWERVDLASAGFPRGHRWGWVNSLTYANGMFVLGGGDGGSAYSLDGRNWTPITGEGGTNAIFHNFHFINGLAYGGGKLVGVGATCSDPNCTNDPKSNTEAHHTGNAGCIAYVVLE